MWVYFFTTFSCRVTLCLGHANESARWKLQPATIPSPIVSNVTRKKSVESSGWADPQSDPHVTDGGPHSVPSIAIGPVGVQPRKCPQKTGKGSDLVSVSTAFTGLRCRITAPISDRDHRGISFSRRIKHGFFFSPRPWKDPNLSKSKTRREASISLGESHARPTRNRPA